jgi:hypothetical protein
MEHMGINTNLTLFSFERYFCDRQIIYLDPTNPMMNCYRQWTSIWESLPSLLLRSQLLVAGQIDSIYIYIDIEPQTPT